MTSRTLIVFIISLVISACGGSSGSSATSPPPPPPPPPANAAPVVDAGLDATIRLPDNIAALDGTVTDDGLPAGATVTYAWSVQSGPAGATFADANAMDTTVTVVNEGTYVLELTADDTALQGSDTVTIVVEPAPVNAAPTADAGPDQPGVAQGATVTLNGSGSSDPDGDPLTYAWTLTSVPTGSAAVLSDATAAGPTFDADRAGSYVAQLVVNDGTADSAPDTVTITVANAAPPTADAGPDQPGVAQGATVTLDGSGSSDPDGDPLTYAWTLTSVPTGSAAVLSDTTVVGPTFGTDLVGTYVAELVVNDGTDDSAPDTVTITVDNAAPTSDAGPDQTGVAQGATVTLDGSGSSDPGGDPLTYAWTLTSVPTGSTAVLSDATVVGPTFDADLVGTYVAELVVNDGTADSAPDTVTITVGNSAPTADAGPDQSGVAQGATVTLDGSGSSDPGGDPLTYAWTLTSVPTGSTAVLSDATVVGPTFDADLAGSYVAELVVNDGTDDSAPDTVTVTVDDIAPAAPVSVTASGEDGQVDLDWANNTEPDLAASPYRVHRSETQGGPYTDVSGPLSASSYVDTPVDNDTTYFYVVTAEDAGGNTSANSAEVVTTPNGPVHAHWTMEEGAGPTTADIEGPSDGTLVGASWTTGVSGNGLDFDGTSGHVVIDNTSDLQITGTQITLTAWIYPRDGSENPGPGIPGGSRVISKRTDAGGADVYAMKLEDYLLCFRLADDACQWSSHVLVLNEWVHVAMVYDGVDQRIYVNGVLDDSGPVARTAPIEASFRPVHLGMREGEGRYFNGVLDEVQIYNRALLDTEVQAIYGAITPPPPAPGLRFTDITESAGTAGPTVGGRGIMFAEVNNDSQPDYYLTNILQGDRPTS